MADKKKNGGCGLFVLVWAIVAFGFGFFLNSINKTGQSAGLIISVSVLIGALCAFIAFCIRMVILTTKMRKHQREAALTLQQDIVEWQPTKTIGTYFQVDDINKKWAPAFGALNPKVYKTYNYDDILEYELLEDNDTIIKGGLGRAVAGGVLFGGVGAIVGGATGKRSSKKVVKSMSIKITLKTMEEPVVYVHFIKTKTKTDSILYKTAFDCAQQTLSVLAQINAQNEKMQDQAQAKELNESTSAADEIRKYNKLLNDGIIDKEEFEAKKKDLLGL